MLPTRPLNCSKGICCLMKSVACLNTTTMGVAKPATTSHRYSDIQFDIVLRNSLLNHAFEFIALSDSAMVMNSP